MRCKAYMVRPAKNRDLHDNGPRSSAGRDHTGSPRSDVNDNFGRWRSDFAALVRHCLDDGVRGGAMVATLAPAEDDYFVLKPKHSG